MNSLNARLIFFPVNFIAESPGFAASNTGGRLSLAPPNGGAMLAHELSNSHKPAKKKHKTKLTIDLWIKL